MFRSRRNPFVMFAVAPCTLGTWLQLEGGIAGTQPRTSPPSLSAKIAAAQRRSGAAALKAPASLTNIPDTAFEAAVHLCEARARQVGDATLSPEVPRLLRRVFEGDFERLLRGNREVSRINVTCMQPAPGSSGAQLFDDELLALPLRPGRACLGGSCCDACSRVVFPALATHAECDALLQQLANLMPSVEEHPHHNLYLESCSASGHVRTTLTFMRLVERMRRAVAHEYGMDLACITPRQTFISRIADKDTTRHSMHCDESSFDSFHYSAVLYLGSQGEHFGGGASSSAIPWWRAGDRSHDLLPKGAWRWPSLPAGRMCTTSSPSPPVAASQYPPSLSREPLVLSGAATRVAARIWSATRRSQRPSGERSCRRRRMTSGGY